MEKIVKATVAALIIRGENKKAGTILLTKRAIEPYKDKWCLPGGHIEVNESAEAAIVREVEEETGLKLKAQFFNYFDEIIPSIRHHNVVIVFRGTGEGEPKLQPEEVTKIEWFRISEALDLNLAFDHKAILQAYVQRVQNLGS